MTCSKPREKENNSIKSQTCNSTRFSRSIFAAWRFLFFTLSALVLVSAAVIAVIGSSATLAPNRRAIEPWHREILNHAEEFGMTIESASDRSGNPYLVCEPNPQAKGKKAQLLRAEMKKKGTEPSAPGKIHGTLMLLHGHKGCKEDHLPVSERFCAAGFRCLCIDLPGHGKNPNAYATFGHKEVSLLIELWRDYLLKHPEARGPLGIFGVSQGGAIALQWAAREPSTVSAVASVCSFASLDQPIAASAEHLPPILRDAKPLTTRACALGIYCRCGFFPSEISPLNAASELHCPVFITHGSKDSFVPAGAAEQIFRAIPHQQKTLRLIENAGHHNVLAIGSTALYADLCCFFLRSMHPAT